MLNGKLVIFAENDAWRVGVVTREGVSIASEAEFDSLAASTDRDVLVALPSSQCLCGSIAMVDLPTRQRRQAMLYRFEEKLPLAAEDVVADFIASSHSALGVAIEKTALNTLMSRLATMGKRVAAVCPASLLALQQWIGTSSTESDSLVLWATREGSAELFHVVDGLLIGWFTLSNEPDDVLIHVRISTAGKTAPVRIVSCGVSNEVILRLKQSGFEVVQREGVCLFEAAAEGGGAVLAGKRRAWIDLADSRSRDEKDSGKTMAWAAAAAIVLLACTTGAFWLRGARYAELAEQSDAQQAEVFRRALPGQAIPFNVRSRLASEAQQASLAGDGKTSEKSPGRGLIVFRDVMSHLPTDVRFRVYEIRLGEQEFALLGEAKSHGDAQGVGDALRRRPGFVIEPPSTEQTPGGAVRFTLAGTIRSEASR